MNKTRFIALALSVLLCVLLACTVCLALAGAGHICLDDDCKLCAASKVSAAGGQGFAVFLAAASTWFCIVYFTQIAAKRGLINCAGGTLVSKKAKLII